MWTAANTVTQLLVSCRRRGISWPDPRYSSLRANIVVVIIQHGVSYVWAGVAYFDVLLKSNQKFYRRIQGSNSNNATVYHLNILSFSCISECGLDDTGIGDRFPEGTDVSLHHCVWINCWDRLALCQLIQQTNHQLEFRVFIYTPALFRLC
jgi:hypothetical protein